MERTLVGISYRHTLTEAVKQQPLAAIGGALLVVITICAVFAPWLAPQDPAKLAQPGRLKGPS